ncbi:MAG: malonyl-ACP O-methyltransferase BioC [Rikenellaceae bacterium]
MINKELIKRRFAAHYSTYNNHAKAQEDICERIAIQLEKLNISPIYALEFGAGTGFLTKHLIEQYPQCSWLLNDISQEAHPYLESVCSGKKVEYLFCDAENGEFPNKYDLIASASTIQWFENPKNFISNLPLNSGGYVAITTFTPDNFKEISLSTHSKGLQYYSLSEYEEWFKESGYTKVFTDSYSMELLFDSPLEVLRHLKYTGVNAIENVQWSRGKLNDFIERYEVNFTKKTSVSLTYAPLLMIFKKN